MRVFRENYYIFIHLLSALKNQFFSVTVSRLLPSLIYCLIIDSQNFKFIKYILCKWTFLINTDFLVNLQCEAFKFFCYMTISILLQNQEILFNIWLKQTLQKVILYFRTSEQQFFGRHLGCYFHYFLMTTFHMTPEA